jgi:hypothetical protein
MWSMDLLFQDLLVPWNEVEFSFINPFLANFMHLDRNLWTFQENASYNELFVFVYLFVCFGFFLIHFPWRVPSISLHFVGKGFLKRFKIECWNVQLGIMDAYLWIWNKVFRRCPSHPVFSRGKWTNETWKFNFFLLKRTFLWENQVSFVHVHLFSEQQLSVHREKPSKIGIFLSRKLAYWYKIYGYCKHYL